MTLCTLTSLGVSCMTEACAHTHSIVFHRPASGATRPGLPASFSACLHYRCVQLIRASQCRRNGLGAPHAGPDGMGDLEQQLKEDMERLQGREASSSQSAASTRNLQTAGIPSSESNRETSSFGLKDGIDKLLMADFFFVLFALGWLGVALGVKGTLGFDALLDTWLGLWQWVFQPAIGVLMLGALVSGGIGWLKSNRE